MCFGRKHLARLGSLALLVLTFAVPEAHADSHDVGVSPSDTPLTYDAAWFDKQSVLIAERYKRLQADYQRGHDYLLQTERTLVQMAPRFKALAGQPVEVTGSENAPLSEADASKPLTTILTGLRDSIAKEERALKNIDVALSEKIRDEPQFRFFAIQHRSALIDDLEETLRDLVHEMPGELWFVQAYETGLRVQILQGAADKWAAAQKASYLVVAARMPQRMTEAFNSPDAAPRLEQLNAEASALCVRFKEIYVQHALVVAAELQGLSDRLVALRRDLTQDVLRNHDFTLTGLRYAPPAEPVFSYSDHPWDTREVGLWFRPDEGATAPVTVVQECYDWGETGKSRVEPKYPAVKIINTTGLLLRMSVPAGDVLQATTIKPPVVVADREKPELRFVRWLGVAQSPNAKAPDAKEEAQEYEQVEGVFPGHPFLVEVRFKSAPAEKEQHVVVGDDTDVVVRRTADPLLYRSDLIVLTRVQR